MCVCKTKKRKSRKETIPGKANCHYQKFKTNKEMKGMKKRENKWDGILTKQYSVYCCCNPYLKIDGASHLIIFSVRDPKQKPLEIPICGFHSKTPQIRDIVIKSM